MKDVVWGCNMGGIFIHGECHQVAHLDCLWIVYGLFMDQL